MKYLQTPLRFLDVAPIELSLRATLFCGQAFRWSTRPATALTSAGQPSESAVEFLVGHGDRTLVLRQDQSGIHYRACYPMSAKQAHEEDVERDTTAQLLRDYFVLSVNLASLIKEWEQADSNFVQKTQGGQFGGIRVLKQDPWEALISFICSSANNIARITLMIRRMCQAYGTPLPLDQYSFPTIEALAKDDATDRLFELGFGYRARYVAATAQMLASTPSPHAHLAAIARLPTPGEQRQALREYDGVGAKVADCVRLFGLGQTHVVPIDVHIGRLAQRDYGLTGFKPGDQMWHDKAQALFAERWGRFAGWAQQILFASELGSRFEGGKAASDQVETPKRESSTVAYPTPAPSVSVTEDETTSVLDTPVKVEAVPEFSSESKPKRPDLPRKRSSKRKMDEAKMDDERPTLPRRRSSRNSNKSMEAYPTPANTPARRRTRAFTESRPPAMRPEDVPLDEMMDKAARALVAALEVEEDVVPTRAQSHLSRRN